MRSRYVRIAIIALLTLTLPACQASRRFVNKPWGKGTYIPAAVCAVIGAGAGVGIKEATRGESSATYIDQSGNVTTRTEKDDPDYWIGALIGAPIGALACGLVGHALLDKEAPPPLPPPPPPVPLPPPSSKRIVLRGVNFDFDQNEIRPDSRPLLNAAIRILNENPNVRISVEGHTDAIGSDEYNNKLSLRRSEAVFRYLRDGGITGERMEVVGFGKTRPVASNDTPSGRAQNRRVELHVVDEPPPAEIPPPPAEEAPAPLGEAPAPVEQPE